MKKFLLLICILFFITYTQNDYIDINSYKSEKIKVEIKGAVNKPGLYELEYQSNVKDLIALAQGYKKQADSKSINEARILKNEDVIVVKENDTTKTKISINSASVDDLCTISGIGPSTAQKIIDYRSSIGSFQTIEDIMNISGIKEKLFNKIKDYITL